MIDAVLHVGDQIEAILDDKRFVVWRWETRAGAPTKVPYVAGVGRKAESDNPSTWRTYLEASTTFAKGDVDGIGYCLMGREGFGALDLDHCRDPVSGEIAAWARDFIARANSYTEITPSGEGVRILGIAHGVPDQHFTLSRGANGQKVEVFHKAIRYITLSQNPLVGTPQRLNDISALLLELQAEKDSKKTRKTASNGSQSSGVSLDGLPADIVALIRHGARPGADRSRELYKVCAVMRRAGFTFEEIEATLRAYPQGIAARCFEGGKDDLARHVRMCLVKIDDEEAAKRAGTWGDGFGGGPQQAFSAPPPDRSDLLVAAWRNLDLPPRDYLLENLMCSTSRWEIIGETGVGKTLFCLDLAFAIAAGANFLNWKGVRPCRVMYLDGELPAETLKERIESAAKLFGEPQLYAYNRDRLTDADLLPLNKPEGQNWLLAEIGGVKPDLIIFDNVMSLLIGKMADEEESWTPVVPFTRQLTARRIAQIWVHHTGHDTSHGFGSKTREWMMDTVAMLTKGGDDSETTIRLEFSKARLRTPSTAHLFKPLLVRRDEHGWTAEPTTSKRRDNVAAQKQRWFVDAYDFLAIDVEAGRGYTSKPVRKVALDRIRDLMVEREQLTAENGKLPERERKAFQRAKEHFIDAGVMTAQKSFIWKI